MPHKSKLYNTLSHNEKNDHDATIFFIVRSFIGRGKEEKEFSIGVRLEVGRPLQCLSFKKKIK